jgi:hypothetical protein
MYLLSLVLQLVVLIHVIKLSIKVKIVKSAKFHVMVAYKCGPIYKMLKMLKLCFTAVQTDKKIHCLVWDPDYSNYLVHDTPTTGSYPEPSETGSCPHIHFFEDIFNINLSPMARPLTDFRLTSVLARPKI